MKELFLKKGWAGKTLSRHETVERLNPILRRHNSLVLAHGAATDLVSDDSAKRQHGRLLNTMRADSGKLSESILSCGGVPDLGAGARSDGDSAAGSDGEGLKRLIEAEQKFLDELGDELKVNHQMRTRAVLGAVQKNTRERIDFLKSLRQS